MSDGKVTITVDLDGTNAQSGVNKLKGLLGGLSDTGQKVGSVFKSVLGANIIGSALTNGISAVGSGLRSMVGELNSSAKAWQTFEGNLQAFGRSKSEIKAAKSEMQDFATKTIYSASEMASTYSQLDAVGTKNVGSLVKAFGGLAASAENPAQAMKSLSTQATQMASKPKVAWMDFKIMMEQAPAGMAAVAKELGMSTAGLVSAVQEGKIKTEDFFDAMNRAGNSDAFQKMATEFKTADQAIDGAKESLSNKLMPAFDHLNKFGIKAIVALTDAMEKINFDQLASGLGKALGKIDVEGIVGKVSSGLGKMAHVGKELFKAFANTGALTALKDAFNQLVKAALDASGKLSGLIPWEKIGAAVGHVVKFLANIVTAIANFSQKMDGNLFRGLVIGIPAVIAAFKAFNFLQGFNPFSFFKKNAETGMSGASQAVGKSRSTIAELLQGISSVIKSVGSSIAVAAKGIGSGLAAAFRGIGQALALANPVAILALGGAIAVVVASLTLLATQGQGVATIIQSIGTAFGTLASMVIGAFAQAIVTVSGVLPTVASALSLLSPLVRALGDAFATVVTAIGHVAPQFAVLVSAVGAAVSQMIEAVSSVVQAFAPIVQTVADAFVQIVQIVTNGIVQLTQAFTPIVQIISDAFVQVVQIVTNGIVQIIQALAPFIPAVTEMVIALAPVLSRIVEAFNHLISQVSPILNSLSKLFEAFAKGVKSTLDGVKGVIESIGGVIRSALEGVAGIFDSMGNAAKNAGTGVKLMAQGIKLLVDLKLSDLASTLATVATGLAGISAASGGLASAGAAMMQLGQGFMAMSLHGQLALTVITGFGTAITGLSSQLMTVPATLTVLGVGFTVFSSQVLASLSSLSAVQAPISGLNSQLMVLVPSLAMVGAAFLGLGGQIVMTSGSFTSFNASSATLRAGLTAVVGSLSQVGAGASQVSGQLHALMQAVNGTLGTFRALGGQVPGLMRSVASSTQAVVSAFNAMRGQVQSAMQGTLNSIRSIGNQMKSQGSEIGRQTAQNLARGISSGASQVSGAMQSLTSAAQSAAMPGVGMMQSVGAMIGQGLAAGMLSALAEVTAAANALIAQAERAAQAKAQIHSPSRLFRDEVGRYISQGIAVGIAKDAPKVDDAMGDVYSQIQAFSFRAEDVIGVGKIKLSKAVQVKQELEQAVKASVEVAKEKSNDLIAKALDVAEKAVRRPSELRFDDDTLVAKTGNKFASYQSEQLRRANRMRGIDS